MNNDEWDRIKEASIKSLQTPGGNKSELPKDEVNSGDNYFIVFRHGLSEDNIKRVFSGWRDETPLTQEGIDNAKGLSELVKLLDLDVIITSDQVRSQQTAKYVIGDNFPNIKWEIDSRIKERNYGDLNGMSKEELMKTDPENAIKWRRSYDIAPPHGESIKMVEARVKPFLDELKDRIKKEKINVAVSAHGNSMRAIRHIMENMDIVTTCTHENPLATDYALYVVR